MANLRKNNEEDEYFDYLFKAGSYNSYYEVILLCEGNPLSLLYSTDCW